jgi:hypothetical protein
MTKLKFMAAAAVLSLATATTAMAEQPYHHVRHYHRGPVGAAVGAAGAVVGTAAAIATAPFRNSYAYDNPRDFGPDGYACHPGTWFRGADGRRHMCQ